MKSDLENRIVGELITQEKYRLVDVKIICEVVRDTVAEIHEIKREAFLPMPPVETFPAVDGTPEIRAV